jgi:uncharacterized protein (DUF362 family)
MHKLTRRDLLKLGAGAALVAGAPAFLGGCDDEQEATESTETTETAEPSSKVAAIRGNDLYAMARQALEAVGGIAAVVQPGETVFIKPNLVTMAWAHLNRNPFLLGECAKIEIVTAVAEECLKAGATEVIIGDATQVSSFSWEYATTLDGATNLPAEAERLSSEYDGKVTLTCLDIDSPDWVEVPSHSRLGTIAISSLVARADRVISIPVLKTHSWAQLSLSLKNFLGVTPLARYGWVPSGMYSRLGFDHSSPQAIAQIYLDIVNAVKPDLAIIDASICVEGNGPSAGDGQGITVDMRDRLGSWLLLASTDLVAADATAARIIKHEVSSIRQLTLAYDMGLGEMREESIQIIGARLDDLRVDWVPAEPSVPPSAEGMPAGQAERHASALRMYPSF